VEFFPAFLFAVRLYTAYLQVYGEATPLGFNG
jgi:hypothetical protein